MERNKIHEIELQKDRWNVNKQSEQPTIRQTVFSKDNHRDRQKAAKTAKTNQPTNLAYGAWLSGEDWQ